MPADRSSRSALPNRRRLLLGAAALGCLAVAPRFARAALASDDVLALTDAYNASGRQLFDTFAKTRGNMVFSPLAIGASMAMALSGARGTTEQEMAKALKQGLTRSQMERASQDAFALLNRLNGRSAKAQSRLLVANALMLSKALGATVLPAYAALAKECYGAEVFKGAALSQINAWAAQNTDGRIEKILDSLDRQSVAVLINAIYLKAAWAQPFEKSAVWDGDFNTESGAAVRTPMMHRQEPMAFVKRPGYRALRLPFLEPQLGFAVVLPDINAELDRVVRDLDFGEQKKLLAALQAPDASKLVGLALPKFKASFGADLIAPFKNAGLNLAFSNEADFSGIVGQDVRCKITQIRHRAFVEVAEGGVEAAAATTVEIGVATARLEERTVERFTVDRPFLFFIVDDASGAVLFEGRIADPTIAA